MSFICNTALRTPEMTDFPSSAYECTSFPAYDGTYLTQPVTWHPLHITCPAPSLLQPTSMGRCDHSIEFHTLPGLHGKRLTFPFTGKQDHLQSFKSRKDHVLRIYSWKLEREFQTLSTHLFLRTGWGSHGFGRTCISNRAMWFPGGEN